MGYSWSRQEENALDGERMGEESQERLVMGYGQKLRRAECFLLHFGDGGGDPSRTIKRGRKKETVEKYVQGWAWCLGHTAG